MGTARKALETDKIANELPTSSEVGSPRATGEARLVIPRATQRWLKSWIISALCHLGGHDEGRWVYLAEGDCAVERDCRRCGTVNVSEWHRREWRYIREHACQQIRRCERCNVASGDRTSHEWGEDYGIKTRWWEGPRRGCRCLRCGEEEEWIPD